MANVSYINTRITFDLPMETKKYNNRTTVLSNFSDSTFDETDFETLDYKNTDRYGEYTRLSKDAIMLSTQGAACYNNVRLDGEARNKVPTEGKQNKMKTRHQQAKLYSNDTMLKRERESIAPPVPRRNRRGNKVIRRISTIPSSVWQEVHGWPKLKTAAVVLTSFVIGAGVVLATIFIYKYIDDISTLEDGASKMSDSGNGVSKKSDCIETKLNGCKNKIHEKDISDRRGHFPVNCSKIHTEIIDSVVYILYGDRMSFSEAADFCHRTARLRMLKIDNKEECVHLQTYMSLNKMNTDSGYWTGEWDPETGDEASWKYVQPYDDIIVNSRSQCVFLQSSPRICSRRWAGCTENKIPICKC